MLNEAQEYRERDLEVRVRRSGRIKNVTILSVRRERENNDGIL